MVRGLDLVGPVAVAAAMLFAGVACATDPNEVAGPPSTTVRTSTSTTDPSTTDSSTTVSSTTVIEPVSAPPPRALGTASFGSEPEQGEPTDPGTALADLRAGDCIDLADLDAAEGTDGREVSSVVVIDCGEPHDAEIYALISLDDDPESRHPGDGHVLAAADRVCLEQFEGYVGARYVDTRLEIVHLRPTLASWARGDRRVICAVVYTGTAPLVGSVAGAGPGAP
jgi:hypothetical protein